MKHEVVATIRFSEVLRGRWPSQRLFGLAHFDSDDRDHPHGKWSLAVEPWSSVDSEGRVQAWIAFVAPEAPQHLLRRSTQFKLFVGPTELAEVTINMHTARGTKVM